MPETDPGKQSNLYKISIRLVSLLLLFIGTLVLLEICLRILIPVLPEPQKSILEEARRITYSNTRAYYGSLILLPEAGKADRVVIGDSFPFGSYVREEDTFPQLLADLTTERTINLGAGSQGPIEYNRMMEIAARYQPDQILYCIFANDLMIGEIPDDRLQLEVENAVLEQPSDKYIFIDGLSPEDERYMQKKKWSNLLLSYQVYKLFEQPLQKKSFKKLVWEKDDLTFHFVTNEFWDPGLSYDQQAVKEGIIKVVRLVRSAYEFSRELNAGFYVVLIPSKEMVYSAVVDEATSKQIYRESHGKSFAVLSSELEAFGIPCLNMTEALQFEAATGKKLYFTIDGHFNELGHRLAAGLIKDYLDRNPTGNYIKQVDLSAGENN